MRNRMLGLFGLMLIVLIGWASDQNATERHTLATARDSTRGRAASWDATLDPYLLTKLPRTIAANCWPLDAPNAW